MHLLAKLETKILKTVTSIILCIHNLYNMSIIKFKYCCNTTNTLSH